MVDLVETPGETDDASGRDSAPGVDDSGNDAYEQAFAEIAAGKPAPETEGSDEGDDTAGQDDDANAGGDEPPADSDKTDPPADAPAKVAAPAAESDPWANASPELLAARDKLVSDYEKRVQGAAGRASGLQRQLNILNDKGKSAAAEPQDKPEPKEKSDAEKALDAKIATLKEDYPEIAGPLIEILTKQSEEIAAMRSQVAPVTEAAQAEVVAQQQSALEAKHPDWADYDPSKNADFSGWLEAQSASIKKLADSWDAQDASVVLTLFKTERAEAMNSGAADPDPKPEPKPDARRQRQLDGGKQVSSKAITAASGAPDDFEAAFAHFAKKG